MVVAVIQLGDDIAVDIVVVVGQKQRLGQHEKMGYVQKMWCCDRAVCSLVVGAAGGVVVGGVHGVLCVIQNIVVVVVVTPGVGGEQVEGYHPHHQDNRDVCVCGALC